jgi:predicted nucleic acid-binding protein
LTAAIVSDASVVLQLVVAEPASAVVLDLFGRHKIMAPDLMLVECGNALWRRCRRGELTAKQARSAHHDLASTSFALTPDRELAGAALELAIDLDHPVHDCLYLALGLRAGVPVVTADRRFAAAAASHALHRDRVVLLADFVR